MFQVDNRENDLPNRHFFNTRLTEVIARSPSGKIVVLFLKIERLMKIKESFGSAFYYKLSDQLTDRLKEVIAPSSYLSMIDDDAFAFFLVNTEQITNIDQQCRQILQQFQTPFQIEGLHIKLYVKIGTSIFPDHGNEPEQLLKNAYYALCKENGDEYNEYDPAIVHEQRQQFIIESELHRALLRDELFLMYQPQLHLKKNEVTGVEALIRWNHPTKGIISPALFIPIAEKSELILQIGEWVLETAHVDQSIGATVSKTKCSREVERNYRQKRARSFVHGVRNYGKYGDDAHERYVRYVTTNEATWRQDRFRRFRHRVFVVKSFKAASDRPDKNRPIVYPRSFRSGNGDDRHDDDPYGEKTEY